MYQGQPIGNAGVTYTFSVYIKPYNSPTQDFKLGYRVDSDSQPGDLYLTTSVIEDNLPNGWQRVSATVTIGTNPSLDFGQMLIGPVNGYTSTKDEGYYIWGYQVEVGAFATSYIPSTDTFTSRASNATYSDETGIIRTAPVNGARYGYNYDGRKWVETGLILEAAATNLTGNFVNIGTGAVLWSTGQGLTPELTTAVTAPDGTMTAVKLKEITTASGASASFYKPVAGTANTQRCLSVYAKAGEINMIRMYFDGTTPLCGQVIYNLSLGTIHIAQSPNATDRWGIEPVGNGWYRCWFSGTVTGGQTTYYWHIDTVDGSGNIGHNTVAGNGCYLWGPQMEYGPVPTSYIYTADSAVTRAADVASSVAGTRDNDIVEMIDAEDVIGQQQGTVYTEWENSGTFGGVFELWDSGTNGIDLRSNGTYYLNDNTSVTWGSSPGTGVFVKTALAYDTTSVLDTRSAFNGTLGGGNASNIWYQHLTKIRFGSIDFNPAYQLNGHIKNFRLYQERLTDAEITALTENN